jgi:hypothetical protein
VRKWCDGQKWIAVQHRTPTEVTMTSQVDEARGLAALLRRKGVLEQHEDRLVTALERWSGKVSGEKPANLPAAELSQDLLCAWSEIKTTQVRRKVPFRGLMAVSVRLLARRKAHL